MAMALMLVGNAERRLPASAALAAQLVEDPGATLLQALLKYTYQPLSSTDQSITDPRAYFW